MRERAEALALALNSKTYSEVVPFRQEAARLIERALLAAYQQGQRDMRERAAQVLPREQQAKGNEISSPPEVLRAALLAKQAGPNQPVLPPNNPAAPLQKTRKDW